MSGGRASRDKGNRFERAIVKLLNDGGFGAERVPLSESAGGSYLGDLTCSINGRALVVEAKARGNGFRELYAWRQNRDVLVVIPLRLAFDLAASAGHKKELR